MLSVIADVGGGGVRDARQQFCVSPCPSYVYTEAEYRSMWLGHVAVGIVTLLMDCKAVGEVS